MQAASVSQDEAQRLATLRALDVLDTGPEEEFDALVRVASLVCGVPVSLVSLIDTERQFFKANIGLPGVSETPRDIAFCAHAILDDALFEVPDASLDPRFNDNPLVTGHPDIRFYAGAPIAMADGQRIGTLCVIDRNPRVLSDDQREILKSLAVAASKALEGRRAVRALSHVSKALQETQDWVGLATKVAGVGIWNFDLASGAITWDTQMYRLYGVEPTSAAGTYELWSHHVHTEDLAAAEQCIQQSLASGEDYDTTFRIVRGDGAIRFIKALGRVRFDAAGKAAGVVGTNMDVTDATLHEQQLQAARDSAEAASLTKGQFLANMSHELRTPMNAVLGLLKVLSNTSLTANQFDYVSKIDGAAKSLLRLLNEILDFSKIEAGKLELDVQPFALDKFLRELGVILSAYVGNKNIDILYEIDIDIPATLLGDSHRLQQIVVNLAGNAVKFTEEGEVVIGLKRRNSSATASSGSVEIEFSVRDSGIGIAPEHQSRLFNSFSQAEASTTRRFGGTGLGLAISKRLIELMGGEISFTSELGKGTTFVFSLELDCLASPATLPFTKTPKRVLLIDDNAIALETMAKSMRSLGWSVDVAQGGQVALELVSSQSVEVPFPYDCVYVDWHMPGLDGWQTVHRITQLQQSMRGDAPRYIMTSTTARQSAGLGTLMEQQKISAFLVKPLTAAMLFDASLPEAPGRLNRRQGIRTGKRELAGMRLLVVEDNAINQQVAEELLSFEGALVSIVGDGRQAVNAVAAADPQYDAILMDVQMPVMDGYEATKAIRKELGLLELPIIGLTANAMPSDRVICLAAGMSEHVGKPFDLAQLTSMLIRLTGKHPDKLESRAIQTEPTESTSVRTCGSMASDVLEVTSPEIDITGALSRMGGMTSLYIRAAKQLRADLSSFLPLLTNDCSEPAVTAVLARLHTFKGTTATVGLHRLSKVLGEIESTCRARGSAVEILQQIPALKDAVAAADYALSEAIKALEPLLSPDSAQVTDTNWRKVLLALIPLLEVEDYSTIEMFAEVRGQLDGLDEALLIQLETAMQNLEFYEACQICRKMLALDARA